MTIYTIQCAMLADLSQPLPYRVDDTGRVLDQDLWNGDPHWLLGFQTERDVQHVDVLVDAFTQDSQLAVGRYPVFSEAGKGMYAFMSPVTSVDEHPDASTANDPPLVLEDEVAALGDATRPRFARGLSA